MTQSPRRSRSPIRVRNSFPSTVVTATVIDHHVSDMPDTASVRSVTRRSFASRIVELTPTPPVPSIEEGTSEAFELSLSWLGDVN